MEKSQKKSPLPLISVVIPSYNEEFFLADCLNSLKAQDFQGSFEVIVVDNNSSDNTAEVAKRYGAKVIFEPRRGVCFARQTGTKAALGEIIVSTDADNIFSSDWLSRIWKGFLKYPEAVAMSGPCEYRNAPWWGIFFTVLLFGSVKILSRLTGEVWYISGCNTAFKKNIWPGYNTNLSQGGDEIDFLRKLRKKGKIKFLSDNLIFTSNRRLRRGMLYSLICTVIWYYVFNYAVALLVGRSLSIFSWPAFRDEKEKMNNNWIIFKRAVMAVTFILIIYFVQAHNAFAHQVAKNIDYRIDSIGNKLLWRR